MRFSAFQGSSPWGLLPQVAASRFSASFGPFWSLLVPISRVSYQPGLSVLSVYPIGDKWVKIYPRLALQAPPEVGDCHHRLRGELMAARGVARVLSFHH